MDVTVVSFDWQHAAPFPILLNNIFIFQGSGKYVIEFVKIIIYFPQLWSLKYNKLLLVFLLTKNLLF